MDCARGCMSETGDSRFRQQRQETSSVCTARPYRSFAETVWIDVLLSIAFILENTWCSSLPPVAVTQKLIESNLEMKRFI